MTTLDGEKTLAGDETIRLAVQRHFGQPETTEFAGPMDDAATVAMTAGPPAGEDPGLSLDWERRPALPGWDIVTSDMGRRISLVQFDPDDGPCRQIFTYDADTDRLDLQWRRMYSWRELRAIVQTISWCRSCRSEGFGDTQSRSL